MMAAYYCRLCGGDLEYLGALGHLRWFRCRACGMQFSRKVRTRKARPKGKVIGHVEIGGPDIIRLDLNKRRRSRRSRRNPLDIRTAWTGKKADFVSRRGNFGPAPHSELAMHTGAAGARIVRFALFSDKDRWPYVTWAHIETSTGQVLDGTPGEVLPSGVRRRLGGFGQEKMPMKARLKANPMRLGR
jgi:hypothetical protein